MDGAAGPSDLSHSMYAGNGAAAEGRQSEEAASTQERQRFFPPPFRIDIDLADDDSDDDGASPGPSMVKQEPVDEEFVLSVSIMMSGLYASHKADLSTSPPRSMSLHMRPLFAPLPRHQNLPQRRRRKSSVV